MLVMGVMLVVTSRTSSTTEGVPATSPISSVASEQSSPVMMAPLATSGPSRPSATPTPPVYVPPSQPTAMEVPQINFEVTVDAVDLGSPIDPPFVQSTAATTVYFDTSRGTRPGSSTSNTSYFAGHTCREAGCNTAFNVLDTRLERGDDIYLTTQASAQHHVRLHYVVTADKVYSRGSLPAQKRVWLAVPNRLVFITCNLRADGSEQTDNHVFYARYVGTSRV